MNDLVVSEVVEKITSFIGQQKGHFQELNQNCINRLDFAKECEFSKQVLLKNDYLLNVARSNPDSLQAAISNVAAIGISLNPALAFAYLVPRKINQKPAVCLDISYRGLTKLATDTGIIKAMKAELVYANDVFNYKGFHVEPEFSANPFGDRGALVGVYAMALLTDGTVLVETMTIQEVNKIRDDSEAFKSAVAKGGWTLENNVWVKFYTEMVKKTVIKRCYKTLPTSKGTEIMGKAIEVLNEHEGIEFDAKPEQLPQIVYTDDELKEYQRCIEDEDYVSLFALLRSLDIEAQKELHNLCVPKAEKGKIGAQKKQHQENIDEGGRRLESWLCIVRENIDSGDDAGVYEVMDGLSQWAENWILDRLTPEQIRAYKQILEAA
jgi:recombination protein RecT